MPYFSQLSGLRFSVSLHTLIQLHIIVNSLPFVNLSTYNLLQYCYVLSLDYWQSSKESGQIKISRRTPVETLEVLQRASRSKGSDKTRLCHTTKGFISFCLRFNYAVFATGLFIVFHLHCTGAWVTSSSGHFTAEQNSLTAILSH